VNHKELILGVSKDPFLLVMVEDEQLEKLLQRTPSQIDAEPRFYGWILAESYVRKWLRSEWAVTDLDLSNDNSFLSIKSDLDHAFKNSKKFRKGLNYVSDRPNRDEELDWNHPKNYFLSRILDFITCDGIVLVVKRDSEGEPGFGIPYKLKSGRASDPQIYDRKEQRLASEEWEIALSEFARKKSEPLNLKLLASFVKGGEELVGTSFLLSLKVAMWRTEKKVSLHPLEFGITGGLNAQSGEIEMVRGLEGKGVCANKYGAFLFVAPSPRPEPKDQSTEEEPMAWINVQNKSLEECLDLIQEQESGMWMKRARKLEFSAGKKHSAITFKLVYELPLPENWEVQLMGGLDYVRFGEGDHMSKLRINHLSKKFSQYLYFIENDSGETVPAIYKFDLSLLKSLDTLRKDDKDPSTKWAKLTSIDLIPFKSKDGIGSVKLGFSFKTIKGNTVSFKDYQKFITQRRFGKVALCNFQENSHSRSISISQMKSEIKKMLSRSKDFSFEELLQNKVESGNQPEVIQYLLSPEEDGFYGDEFWKELIARPDFRKAFELISALSDINRNEAKSEHQSFQMDEAVFTQYAIHHRAITAWSHSADQFNRDTKPNLMTKPFSFIRLLARIAQEAGLDIDECEKIFEDNVQTRKTFFRECIRLN
jgi:hypothetical protein